MMPRWTMSQKNWNFTSTWSMWAQEESNLHNECWIHLLKPKVLPRLLNGSLNSRSFLHIVFVLTANPCHLWFLNDSKVVHVIELWWGKGQHSQIPRHYMLQEVKIMYIRAWNTKKSRNEKENPKIFRSAFMKQQLQGFLLYQQISCKKNQTGFRTAKLALAEAQAAAICITICSWGPNYWSNLILV